MKHPRRALNLYTQLLILFFVSLVPVQLTGGAILIRSTQSVRQNTMDKTERALQSAVDSLCDKIETIFQRCHSTLYATDSNVLLLLNLHREHQQHTWWIAARDVLNELAWIQRSDDAILDICLFYPSLGFALSNSEAYVALAGDEMESMLRFARGDKGLLQLSGGALTMIAAYPSMALSNPSGSMIVLQVTLSPEALRAAATEKVYAGDCLVIVRDTVIAGEDDARAFFQDRAVASGEMIRMNTGEYYAFAASGSLSGLMLVNLVAREDILADTYVLQALLWVYVLICAPIFMLYAMSARHMVRKPARLLLRAFDQVRQGRLDTQLIYHGPTEFTHLIDGFNEMVSQLDSAVQTIYAQKTYSQHIELKQLQAQINPHFLYNTFFMLERMVDDEDMDNARAACRYLGEYFRYITRSGSDTTSLSREFAHATNYLMLQKMRYEGRLRLDMDALPEAVAGLEVPRLIFQPILENAFNYGFSEASKTLVVHIRICLCSDGMTFSFENSAGVPPDTALALDLDARQPDAETTGLMNIHKRIRLKYGAPYGLTLSLSALGGLAVTIRLPLKPATEGEG